MIRLARKTCLAAVRLVACRGCGVSGVKPKRRQSWSACSGVTVPFKIPRCAPLSRDVYEIRSVYFAALIAAGRPPLYSPAALRNRSLDLFPI